MFEQLTLFRSSTLSVPFTVSKLTGHISRLIEGDSELRDLWVEGEVSNFRQTSSGHCYFTLKDSNAEIACVMWRGLANRQQRLPIDGELVLSHGQVGVYEARGRYQLYVDRIRPAGIGDLYQQFEQLRERLEAEGLFAAERKKPLPEFPLRIGVVTSPSAAALSDITSVLSRRYPLADVLLSPTLVQGDAAPAQIVRALEALDSRPDVDVIIVARGGGSLEELWAFNDERVARAIAAAATPVVCGVGHETDFSLADFAADVRAPTPTAAAELAVPDRVDLRTQVSELAVALGTGLRGALVERRWRLSDLARALRAVSPLARLVQARQRVDDLATRVEAALRHDLTLRRARLDGLVRQLDGIGPSRTLERGYAIVRRQETRDIVRSITQVGPGDSLSVRVADGEFGAQVE